MHSYLFAGTTSYYGRPYFETLYHLLATTATDFADWLVKELNMPFRYAHETIGKIVKLAEKKSCNLGDLSLVELQSIHPKITVEIFSRLNIENSVNTRTSYGGTAPSEVVAQIDEARKRYLKD